MICTTRCRVYSHHRIRADGCDNTGDGLFPAVRIGSTLSRHSISSSAPALAPLPRMNLPSSVGWSARLSHEVIAPMGRIMLFALLLVGCTGCAADAPSTTIPPPAPTLVVATSVPTVTPIAGRTCIAELRQSYPTPSPGSGISFESAPDLAKGGVRYTGTLIFTWGEVGSVRTAALYMTNTSAVALPTSSADFTLIFDSGHTESLSGRVGPAWPASVVSGGTVRVEIASGGARAIRWDIGGNLGTVIVPFTEPSGTPVAVGPTAC